MTEANSRMARLETDPVLREEAETIRIMTAMYCRDRHGTSGRPDGLCPECSAFLAYALKRLACCPYGASKPVCAKCRIHCYRAKEKAQAREVMRHAGPRLAASHPVLSIRHLVKSLTVKAPEKPRNKGDGMMRKVLLSIPPALSTLLFCAHLLYHGVPLAAAAAPLGALILLAVKGAGATRLLALLHVLFACEWARAGGKIVMRRLETGGSIHPALEIMAGVTLFTILAAWCSLARHRD